MAKRAKSKSAGSDSLVSLAKKFETLSTEVVTLAANLRKKETQLAQVRRDLANATGMSFSAASSGDSPSRRGKSSPASGGGAPRSGTLGDAILKLMADGAERGPGDVFDGVKKAGYSSDAAEKSQTTMINQTLSKLVKSGGLRRTGRGKYAKA